MTDTTARLTFEPRTPDPANVISWIHIGDLHMKKAGEQNELDLQTIVERINHTFAPSVAFAYLPGDVADDGSKESYAVVRQVIDRLQLPWCAILGDHDVHEKKFDNFLSAMSSRTYYEFAVGRTSFLALNAFDEPHPASFALLPEQLRWLEHALQQASRQNQQKVLLLHCYPTDLKAGGEEIRSLISRYDVRLVDMGHTHYNEISNDGHTLYTATRSTGQIEEGPVGFSLTNLDGDAVSWRFVELSEPATVMITSPSDERLLTDAQRAARDESAKLKVRAKLWGFHQVKSVVAGIGGLHIEMEQLAASQVWQGVIGTSGLSPGRHSLVVRAQDTNGTTVEDDIFIYTGGAPPVSHQPRDQDNALPAWPKHGLLGTQLGPNKNGRKW